MEDNEEPSNIPLRQCMHSKRQALENITNPKIPRQDKRLKTSSILYNNTEEQHKQTKLKLFRNEMTKFRTDLLIKKILKTKQNKNQEHVENSKTKWYLKRNGK